MPALGWVGRVCVCVTGGSGGGGGGGVCSLANCSIAYEEILIFVILCVLCFQRQHLLTINSFILGLAEHGSQFKKGKEHFSPAHSLRMDPQ